MRRDSSPMLSGAGRAVSGRWRTREGRPTASSRCCSSFSSGILEYSTKSFFVLSSRGRGISSFHQAVSVPRSEGRRGLPSAAIELGVAAVMFTVVV